MIGLNRKARLIFMKRIVAILTVICLLGMPAAISEEIEIADTTEAEAIIGEIELEIEGETEQSISEDAAALDLPENLLLEDEAVGVEDALDISISRNAAGIEINQSNFPDDSFRDYVRNKIDKNEDSYLSDDEIVAVTTIDVWNRGITTLKGIEYFTELVKLICDDNKLDNSYYDIDDVLNIVANTKLEYLKCSNNPLVKLDVSCNTKLKYLACSACELQVLDIEKNDQLEYLDCSDNDLRYLYMRDNVLLEYLDCSDNDLGYLDVRDNKRLKKLYCSDCKLGKLDVRRNTKLEELDCSDNRYGIGSDNLDNAGLEALDVSKNRKLKVLRCYWNNLEKLDVSRNTKLIELSCGENYLEKLDVSKNTKLTELECSQNDLTELNVSNNPKLKTLWFYKNNIGVIDLGNCPFLSKLVEKRTPVYEDSPGGIRFSDDDGNTGICIAYGCIVMKNKKVLFGAPPSWTIADGFSNFGLGEKTRIIKGAYAVCATYYQYKSSNPKVVAVNSYGFAKGKKAGTAKITVTGGVAYPDGGGKSVTFVVRVKKAPDKITVSPKKMTLKKGDVERISWKLPKGTASAKISFSSSDRSICKVVEDAWAGYVVKAYKPGTATIAVKTYNGKKATCKVTVLGSSEPS